MMGGTFKSYQLPAHHIKRNYKMDAFLLLVMLPLLGAGIYYVKENDFVQSTIGNIKKRIGEKKDE